MLYLLDMHCSIPGPEYGAAALKRHSIASKLLVYGENTSSMFIHKLHKVTTQATPILCRGIGEAPVARTVHFSTSVQHH